MKRLFSLKHSLELLAVLITIAALLGVLQTFIIGKHFLKPSSKKILFKWSEIHKWMKDPSCTHEIKVSKSADYNPNVINSDNDKPKSSISI